MLILRIKNLPNNSSFSRYTRECLKETFPLNTYLPDKRSTLYTHIKRLETCTYFDIAIMHGTTDVSEIKLQKCSLNKQPVRNSSVINLK